MDWILIALCVLLCCGCREDISHTLRDFSSRAPQPVVEVAETETTEATETTGTTKPDEPPEVEDTTEATETVEVVEEVPEKTETEEEKGETEAMSEKTAFGTVCEVGPEDKFDEMLSRADVTVIDFSGAWCGPCKILAPEIAKMAEEFPTVCFYSVDVDKCREIVEHAGNVMSLPCVIIYAQGKEVDRVVGCAPAKIRASINKIVNEQTSEK